MCCLVGESGILARREGGGGLQFHNGKPMAKPLHRRYSTAPRVCTALALMRYVHGIIRKGTGGRMSEHFCIPAIPCR